MKIFFTRLSLVLILFAFLESCSKKDAGIVIQPNAANVSSKVATEWMHLMQKVVQSEGSNPPVASRIYAYSAIALYEAVRPGSHGYKSLEGQVPGLSNLPDPAFFRELDYIAAANEALYRVAIKIFPTLKPENLALIEDLHKKYFIDATRRILNDAVINSTDFGKMVATAVLIRANSDNFSTTRGLPYTSPSPLINASNWAPTSAVLSPLEPFWGQIKCFAMDNSDACTIKSTIPFSVTPGSHFYEQAKEVIAVSANLTEDQKAIAKWWSDGSSQTATPPGHWVAIVDQIAERQNLGLSKTAEVYVMLNIALADAFISCWDEKFKLNLLRPVTYAHNFLPANANWTPLLETPPFPEYPSGHSVASSAAGDILTSLLGNVSFIDSANTYLGYAPRSYNSFTHASNEAAMSRLYGGIHFREAIEKGLLQGQEVAKAVFKKIHLK